MSAATFQKFIDATHVVAADLDREDYMPTYLTPAGEEFLVLQGVPDDVCMQTASRDWAKGIGDESYYLGYQMNSTIVLEHYEDGHLVETAQVEIVNSSIQ